MEDSLSEERYLEMLQEYYIGLDFSTKPMEKSWKDIFEELDTINDEILQIVENKLKFKSRSSREFALRGVFLMDKLKLYHFNIRGYVLYPDLLEYLLARTGLKIEWNGSLQSMFCRCIENPGTSWNRPSFSFLLNFSFERGPLLLLRGKYNLDEELIEKARQVGLVDPYYEMYLAGKSIPYAEPSEKELYLAGKYYGYRQAYHALLYGNDEQKQEIWKYIENSQDCVFTACCDFYGLEALKESLVLVREKLGGR